MADKNIDKETLKAQKEAEKAAKKAKQERIKQSKPKKEGNIVTRGTAAVKKFCKDFVGTCKKVAWPTGKQVIKNSGVVLAAIAIVTLAVAAVDWGLTTVFNAAEGGMDDLAAYFTEEHNDEDTTAENESNEETSADEETSTGEEDTTEEETTSDDAE